MSAVSSALFGWILAGIAVPTCLANGLLIYALCSERRLHTVTNRMITSMAVSDLAVGVITLPLRAMTSFSEQITKIEAVCLTIHIASFYFSAVSLYHLLIIAIERFCAIVYPLRYMSLFSARVSRVAIFAAWAFPVVYAIVPLVNIYNGGADPKTGTITVSGQRAKIVDVSFQSNLSMEDNGTVDTNNPQLNVTVSWRHAETSLNSTESWMMLTQIINYSNKSIENTGSPACKYGKTIPCWVQSVMYLSIVVVFLFMVLLYLKIFWVAVHHIRKIHTEQVPTTWSKNTFKKELRAFVVSVTAVVWFFITYCPLLFRYVQICFFNSSDSLTSLLAVIALVLVYFNSTVNPFIYGLGSRDIRHVIFRKMGFKRCFI